MDKTLIVGKTVQLTTDEFTAVGEVLAVDWKNNRIALDIEERDEKGSYIRTSIFQSLSMRVDVLER